MFENTKQNIAKIKDFLNKDLKDVFKIKGDKEMNNQELLKQIKQEIANYRNKPKGKMTVLQNIESLVEKLTGKEPFEELKNIYSLIGKLSIKDKTLIAKKEKILKILSDKIPSKEDRENNKITNPEPKKEVEQQKPTQQSRVQTNKETPKMTTQLSNCNDDIKEIKKDIQAINHKIEFQPKIDLKPIENKIYNVEKAVKNIKIPDCDCVKRWDFGKKMDDIENKLNSISQAIKSPKDYLKNNDFIASNNELNKKLDLSREILEDNEKNIKKIKYQTDDIVKELKEFKEDSESIPAQIKNLDEKLDKIIDSTSKNSQNENITKEEKAFVDLADFMRKGVDEFEKVALEYSKNIAKIENLEKLEKEHKETIQKEKENSFKDGEKQARINLIKDIFETFPTQFDTIKSMFDEVTEKFKKDEEIEITNENQNKYLPFLSGEIELGKYKILSPVILLDNQVLQKAEVEKIVIEEETIEKEMPKEEEVEDKNIVENNKEVENGE